MRLKSDIHYAEFIKQVSLCHGEVRMVTEEGDQLNLKSTLSQFVFLAAVHGHVQFRGATLMLQDPEDAPLLAEFTDREG